MPTFTDSFPTTGGPPIPGNWATPSGAGAQGMKVTAAHVAGAAVLGLDENYSTALVSWPNDQNSSVTLGANTGATFEQIGPAVRLQTTSVGGYAGFASSNGTLEIAKLQGGGSVSSLKTASGYTWTIGDVLTLTATGTTLTLAVNGVIKVTTTDSSFASGSPGVSCDTFSGFTIHISAWSSTTPNTTPPGELCLMGCGSA